MAGKLFLLSAPSGCGKTTIVTHVIKDLEALCQISRVITYTSRLARSTDAPGVDYHFLSEQEFQKRIKQNFFLEWSCAYGNYYGTPRSLIEHVKNGQSYVAIVDRAGIKSILQAYQASIAIWLEPPSFAALEQRLRGRGTEQASELEKRLQLAQAEIKQEQESNLCKYCIVNDVFAKSLEELKKIIISELNL